MRRRGWLIAAAVGLLLAIVAGWLASGPLLRRLVIDDARNYRVALEFEEAQYSREKIILDACTITLIGVPGVTARIERLTIELEDWQARAIEAQGVSVLLEGSSVELVRSLRAWGEGNIFPSLSASLERVSWTRDGVEWLRLERGKLDAPNSELRVDAEQLTLFGRDVGPMLARIASGRAYVSLALGGDIAAAPVVLVAEIDREPFEADIALAPTPLTRLAHPLGVALAADLGAAGNAHLRFSDSLERGPILGRAQALLEGYVPPVPIEIRKLAFGKTTEIETLFETSDDRELVSFSGTRVKHGVVGLEGGGTIERKEGRAVLHALLEGRLLCRDVAASAASAHAEGPLADWLSDLGRATLRGSVGIRVVIDADFANLGAARIVPTVGVGCGLRF